MEDFYYNFIKDKFADKAEMLLTDNDSLMYKIEVETFTKIKSYLISLFTQKIQSFAIIQIT